MDISVSGVGCLPDLRIKSRGITVISGLNSTGKSTILKTVYSILHAATEFDTVRVEQIRENLTLLKYKYGEQGSKFLYKYDDIEDVGLKTVIESLENNIDKNNDQDMQIFEFVKNLMAGNSEEEFMNQVIEYKIRAEFEDMDQFRSMDSKKMAHVKFTDGLSADCKVYKDGRVKFTGNRHRIPSSIYYDSPFNVDNQFFAKGAVGDHRSDIIESLIRPENQNLILENTIKSNIAKFDSAIEKAIPGRMVNTKSGLKYKTTDGKLFSIRNVAAGAKVFSIIRMLVDKGFICEGSILLLDEPEVHLHPQWINVLAHAILILARDLKVKIIMTTHSPQLLMAIESEIKNSPELATFYHLSKNEDGTIKIDEINDNLEIAYDEMATPIQKIASSFWV